MTEFQCASGVEVLGLTIMGFINAFPSFAREQGMKILERHGIKDVNLHEWYPKQPVLDVLHEIQDTLGDAFLARMGEYLAGTVELPSDWKTLDVILPGINAGYQMQHRGGDPGHYTFGGMESTFGLTRAKVICSCHDGCSFSRGIVEGLAKRFRPEGTLDVLVRHDDTAPCMKKGADSCTFVITWS